MLYEERRRKENGKREIIAYHNGELVAVIEENKPGYWDDKEDIFDIFFAKKSSRYSAGYESVCGGHIGRASSVILAKKKLEEAWEKRNEEEESEERGKVKMNCLPAFDDGSFFPTPSKLAGQMLGKVNWKNVKTVLEPSAGKGDLIDCVKRLLETQKDTYRVSEIVENADVIEADPNLRALLKGKGYHVVSDDFLSFFTGKWYDVIVMNPPFADGDAHLLKAISMQEHGGQIVCLLNAETIRNPYTNRRKVLANVLAKYNASIEFVEGAFLHAERKTDVEVAIVYLNIPKPARESEIFNRMKKAEDDAYIFQHNGNTEALVSADWRDQLVSLYNVELRCGLELFKMYDSLQNSIHDSLQEYLEKQNENSQKKVIEKEPLIQLAINGHCVSSEIKSETVQDFIKRLRLKYWTILLNQEQITSTMTSKMREDYQDKIYEMEKYDFSIFNINVLMEELQDQLVDGVRNSIITLFDELSNDHAWYTDAKTIHYYSGWKTNKAHKVGMKAIIPINGAFSDYGWDKGKLVDYHIHGIIQDLERAMNYLDNRETTWHCNISRAIELANSRESKTVDFTWFSATFYKKGTCHIKFHKDAERIVERLNIFAGKDKNWLPPCYGKKAYSDMTQEEKTVIDSFQGQEAYAKVMENPGKYILQSAEMLGLPAMA